MKRILKYELTVLDGPQRQVVMTPIKSKVLSAVEQNGSIFVYLETDTAHTENVYQFQFLVVGTGWEFNEDETWRFVDTVKVGKFVWHVYEAVGDFEGKVPYTDLLKESEKE